MKNVLAFFGAFNPPTRAHVELADFAFRAAGREGVIFVPSRADYIRNDQGKDGVLSGETRLAMLEKIAETRPWMEVTDRELREPVLRHERVHLRRGDQWWKLLGWVLICTG